MMSGDGTGYNTGDDTGVRVEKNGVYMILWDTGVLGKYHWGLFIAKNDRLGVLFHQTLSGTSWQYIIENKNVAKSRSLLTALKIGVLPDSNDEWIDMVKSCIKDARVEGDEFTCRTWALAALYEMASGGLIGLTVEWKKILDIEAEAKEAASNAKLIDVRIVTRSNLSMP